jgi:hypothetical protein
MRIAKAIPHKDIGFTTALNDLFMCMPGLSKCHNHGRCIQDPHETDTKLFHKFEVDLLK